MAKKGKSRGRPSLNARIADVLRERVAAMKPGEPFGTEVALATECGVTRMTVREGIGWMLWTLEDRYGAGQPFPTLAKKVEHRWEVVEQSAPRYWIPFPEVWGPVARIVASPFPCPLKMATMEMKP